MKLLSIVAVVVAIAITLVAPPARADEPALDPLLCQGDFLTVDEGAAMLAKRLAETPTRAAWEAYAAHVRECILRGADLEPLPRRIPLNVITRNKRTHGGYNGYTVENVAFETVPGYYAACNLYRPTNADGPTPVVLCPVGHWGDSRFNPMVQIRCAMLAKMGATAMSIGMFGWGSSPDQAVQRIHVRPLALTMQTWSNMRALDYLLSLDGVDPKRVGVTGASGGGTQTFLLTALDDRVRVSVPVVMVSSHMFGGCLCESGKPIHRSAEHFTNNAEIAAMAAPRPMLVVSDGGDWTASVPDVELPFIRKIYALFGAEGNIEGVHFPNEGHDYGPSKRKAMYRFMAARLGLDLAKIQDAAGQIDESGVVVEDIPTMQVFDASHPFPKDVCRSLEEIEASLKSMQAEALRQQSAGNR